MTASPTDSWERLACSAAHFSNKGYEFTMSCMGFLTITDWLFTPSCRQRSNRKHSSREVHVEFERAFCVYWLPKSSGFSVVSRLLPNSTLSMSSFNICIGGMLMRLFSRNAASSRHFRNVWMPSPSRYVLIIRYYTQMWSNPRSDRQHSFRAVHSERAF